MSYFLLTLHNASRTICTCVLKRASNPLIQLMGKGFDLAFHENLSDK